MFSSQNSQVSNDANYIEDVFSTYLYTGTGASQTITNGIDLAGEGGLVWIKQRNQATSHRLFDTARGVQNSLASNSTAGTASFSGYLTAFNSNGFSVGSANDVNESGFPLVSLTIRKQAKFFDVVTYTGTGASKTITHSLGSTPGCIITKRTDSSGPWAVGHRGMTSFSYGMYLNTTDAESFQAWFSNVGSTSFDISGSSDLNVNGGTYVAYVFAHNAGGFGLTGTDNVISCGSFTTNSGGSATVSLGYEPQWVLIKRTTGGTGSWQLHDNMRGFSLGRYAELDAESAGAEGAFNGTYLYPTATGFVGNGIFNTSSDFIYIAIRRGPMKVPTDATKVFEPVVFTDADKLTTAGFPVDTAIEFQNISASNLQYFSNRLTAPKALNSRSTAAETTETQVWTSNTQVQLSNQGNSYTRLYHMFRRAPNFMDVVCWTGTGADQTLTHNLQAVPELIIYKKRGSTGNWYTGCNFTGSSYSNLALNLTSSASTLLYSDGGPFPAQPTATQFSVGQFYSTATTLVAYLFATCAGVSKVFSYTGNGSSQTINCGFTGGARWILIKRTDSTGDWYVWDSARGIVSGNDPHLSLNTTAAEVTSDDTIDTDSTGFVVNQVSATNVNVSSATYIGIAIA
jgi:hypothetical protein